MKLLDRYLTRQFLTTLVFSLVALCIIFLIVSLLENLDDFLDNDATIYIIAEYYLYYFPEILKILTPVATLLSVLFTVGRMSTANEITAMKSGGMSVFRLMLPLSVICIILSFGHLYFNGWIVPQANKGKFDIESEYLNKGRSGGPIYNLYFRDNPNTNVLMRYYSASRKTGNKISIEHFTNSRNPRMTSRIEANKIIWDSARAAWELENGIRRIYSGKNVQTMVFDSLGSKLKITHNQLIKLKKSPDEMNLDELREYIAIMKRGGKDVRRQMIDYYGQYAFPFANFIVILFGVPFAAVRKKGGIAIQIGAAMVISFLYLLFTKIGQTIGYASDINPIFSAWMANIFFFIAGIVNLLKTRT